VCQRAGNEVYAHDMRHLLRAIDQSINQSPDRKWSPVRAAIEYQSSGTNPHRKQARFLHSPVLRRKSLRIVYGNVQSFQNASG
jgi:hypothetical protein